MSIAHDTQTTAFKMFRTALYADRRNLTRDERRMAIKLARSLVDDLECELWADEMGINIPESHSDEWMVMYREYLGRND